MLYKSTSSVSSQVLLVLTTFQVPLFMMRFGQSNLYRRWEMADGWWHNKWKRSSTLFAMTLLRVSHCNFVSASVKTMGRPSKMSLTWSITPSSRRSLASPSVPTTLGRWVFFSTCTHLIIKLWSSILLSPDGRVPDCVLSVWFQVILTGDVSEIGGFRLFRSQDFGLTFVPTNLPFEPLIQMLYNPGDCNALLTLSITVLSFMPWRPKPLILTFVSRVTKLKVPLVIGCCPFILLLQYFWF